MLLLALSLITACRRTESAELPAADQAFYATPFHNRPTVPELTALGALAFRDPAAPRRLTIRRARR